MQIHRQNETCPACERGGLDDSVECFEGVCDNCGFVIREDTDSVSFEWAVTDNTFVGSESRDWMSKCRVRNATEQQIAQAFQTIEIFADAYGASDKIRNRTADLYCDAFRAGTTDGRVTECIVAACLCLASRQADKPIPMSRLTEPQDVDENKFHLGHIALCDDLNIELYTPKLQDYVPFLQSELDLTDADQNRVEDFLNQVEGKQEFVGKDPAGIAAGSVYVLLNEFTQGEVAEAVGVSIETVRKRVNQLRGVTEDE